MNLTMKLAKRVFAVFAAITLVFTVAACDGFESPLNEIVDSVSIVYSAGDSDVAVTQDVSLPTSFGDATISWTSSNQNVISNDGDVTRGFSNVTVTLTARVDLNGEVATVNFTVTVLGYDADAMLDDLSLTGANISYNATLELFEVTGDFTIPQSVDGFSVSWSSTAPSIVSTDGVVNIPEYGQPDAIVTLTASINGVELDFELVVKASTVAPDPDMVRLEEAKVLLLISGVSDGVLVDVDLPMFVGAEGSADRVSVTWSSSNPAVLADDGTVTRPAPGSGNVTVTMTATLTLNGKSVTKDFDLIVIEEVSATPTDSIADAIAKSIDENGNVVAFYAFIPGVTILGITNDGVVIMDDTGILFMYGADGDDLAIGEVYDVQGVTDNYFGGWQLGSGNGQPIIFIPSSEAATPFNPTVSASVNDILATTHIPDATDKYFNYEYYEVTAKVVVTDPADRYGTFLTDVTYTGDGSDITVDPNSAQELDAWMIYYQSNYQELHAFDGLEVTLEVLMYSYRTDRTVFTGLFFGTAADVSVNLTDAETLALIEDVVSNAVEDSYTQNTTLELPTTLFGATITYSSDDAAIDATTGAVTIPASGIVDVTLSVSVDLNGTTDTFDLDVRVGELTKVTVAEARAEASGTPVYVEGIVTSISYNTQYSNAAVFIQDGTAGIYLYRLTDSANIKVGDKIEVKGYMDTYNGLVQVANVYEMNVLSSDNPFVAEKLESGVDPITLQSEYIFVYGTLDATPAITTTGRDTSVSVTYGTGESMVIYIPSEGDFSDVSLRTALVAKLNGLSAGDEVSIFGALGWYNGGQLYVTNPDQIFIGEYKVLNDAESVAEDLLLTTLVDEIVDAGTLTLPTTGAFGSSFAWTSSDDAIINASTGAVTLPATGNVDITLTLEASKGSEVDTKTFTIKVGIIVKDILDTKSMAEGSTITIVGVLTGQSSNSSFWLQDSTDAINVYVPSALRDQFAAYPFGTTLQITGELDIYNGLYEIAYFDAAGVTVLTGDDALAMPVADDVSMLDFTAEALFGYQSKLVEVNGFVVASPIVEDGYGTITFSLVNPSTNAVYSFKMDNRVVDFDTAKTAFLALQVGDVVNVSNVIMAWSNNAPAVALFNGSTVAASTATYTDAELLATAVANTTLPAGATDVTANVTLPTTTILGVTIDWSSSNTAVMADDGTVTRPTDADAQVTMSYTFTLGTETTPGSIDFTVKMVDESAVSYTETFDNSNATSSYADNSFVGDNGITWTYVASRDENGDANNSGINGNGLMLRYNTTPSSITSSTISGGISYFEVKLYKGFTGGGDRQVEVFINGVSIGTSTIFDDFDEHIFIIDNINISGDFTIEIRNITPKQIIIDDITWRP